MQKIPALRLALLSTWLATIAGCSGDRLLNAVTSNRGYTLSKDVAFGNQGLKLDVYTPNDAAHAPVVVFFYGGSWQASLTLPKSGYKFVGQALAAQGFVTLIPDYRVYPQVRYPSFVEDCAEAVVWAHQHAADYGGDPGQMVLMGHSAGAYNAAMLSLEPDFLAAAGGDRGWIRGMVGLSGPYDFLPLVDDELKVIFGPPDERPVSQPINHADGHNPPMLLLAGRDDTIVYARNSENLAARIKADGGMAETKIFERMSHIKIVAELATRLPIGNDVMPPVAAFIRSVGGSGTPANYGVAKAVPEQAPSGSPQ